MSLRTRPRFPWRLALASACGLCIFACASNPRPRVMSQVESVQEGAAAKEAKALAPQAYAHAEQLYQKANAADDEGRTADAQILGEHALAAYSRAFILARSVKAEARLKDVEQALQKAKSDLAKLDEQQQRIAAEADNLEMRVKVARDALPLIPSAKAAPQREAARRKAVQALSSQARLLCIGAHLLQGETPALKATLGKLGALEEKAEKPSEPAPIDDAIQLRSDCLHQLTLARRVETRKAPAAGVADGLLAELTESAQFFAFRDDRGVVVTLRDLFQAGKLRSEIQEQLQALGRVAKAHAEVPLIVALHTARGSKADSASQAEHIAAALKQGGAPKVTTHVVGAAQPVVDPGTPGAAKRNARVEVVFVTPAL